MKHIDENTLLAYHLNELSKEEELAVLSHLLECVPCQGKMDLLMELDDAWQKAPSEIPVTKHLEDQIMLQIASQPISKHIPKKNAVNWKSIFHLGVSAAATILFIHQGIFYEASAVSYQMVHSFLEAPEHFQQLTDKSKSILESNVLDFIKRNR